ncbi:MAG: coproporphyrinogen dehydrogenase HemZ [Clostridiales bacterium]|jgi:oxygen-independent coproporphyrinogen-3 oxidase|nr:coproporphyrinogen dehydrogenase HemZ [Clostridiales bacterium]
MDVFLKGHSFLYEAQTTAQIFFPNEPFNQLNQISSNCITCVLESNEIISEFIEGGRAVSSYKIINDGDTGHNIKLCLYGLLSKLTGVSSPWGVLTGVRPAKLAGQLLNSGYSEEGAISLLQSKYLVGPEKARLCVNVYKQGSQIVNNNDGNSYSLYIGIPFCPSRCVYCSFTSYPIEKYQHIIYNYIGALEKEMATVNNYFKPKRLENIYIGGGTPTSLSHLGLDSLLSLIEKYFDLSGVKEFTVEAGRPDTINQKKLEILKKYNVTRISINPQTMNDKTLEKIGRAHTVNDFLQSFGLARRMGFDNINVDLIIGLPGENLSDILHTAGEISKLAPESITAHTLAIKRASKLKEGLFNYGGLNIDEGMIGAIRGCALSLGMVPYYLYRQKNMMGNFENVGYARPGLECAYNVQIMEEKQHIIALGAGAVSKLVDLETDRVERVFNVKSIEDYLSRIDEMAMRKDKMFKEWFS